MIVIDGLTWDVPCEIHRTAELQSSEISGLMLDLSYFNDVLGTFMAYDVGIAVPWNMLDDYSAIYELLTDPLDGHTFILPYNQDYITITGRVANVKDTLYKTADGNYWEGCTFTVIANHPSKYMSLDEVITRGRTPVPGQTVYADADERYY